MLNAPGTPQNLAANWLIDDDAFLVCPGDEKLMQRYVMALFYYSTEGSSWSSCGQVGACSETNFLSAVHECEWAGTTCNSDLCITEIMFGTCFFQKQLNLAHNSLSYACL